jgi:hypothetical protein
LSILYFISQAARTFNCFLLDKATQLRPPLNSIWPVDSHPRYSIGLSVLFDAYYIAAF